MNPMPKTKYVPLLGSHDFKSWMSVETVGCTAGGLEKEKKKEVIHSNMGSKKKKKKPWNGRNP